MISPSCKRQAFYRDRWIIIMALLSPRDLQYNTIFGIGSENKICNRATMDHYGLPQLENAITETHQSPERGALWVGSTQMVSPCVRRLHVSMVRIQVIAAGVWYMWVYVKPTPHIPVSYREPETHQTPEIRTPWVGSTQMVSSCVQRLHVWWGSKWSQEFDICGSM